jgi:hypothetical protein
LQRDLNKEADALTNSDFSAFTAENRVTLNFEELDWIILPKMMDASEAMYKDIISQKAKTGAAGPKTKLKKLAANKRLRWTDPW